MTHTARLALAGEAAVRSGKILSRAGLRLSASATATATEASR